MPLNLADKNKTYVIQRIVGREGVVRRLKSLGFVPETEIRVLSEIDGNLLASSRINRDVGNMVYTDVTGIKNKLAYQTQLNRLNEERDTFSVGVVMFDLNNLKIVNDTHGHEMGDCYIEAFSSLLSYLQNDRISAYRIGGDEFAMILEQTNAVEIHHILDKLEVMVREYNAKHSIQISYARGYEISTSEHYYLMEELTKRADYRMYKHKKTMKEHRRDREQIS